MSVINPSYQSIPIHLTIDVDREGKDHEQGAEKQNQVEARQTGNHGAITARDNYKLDDD